ncbi:MAG TPA: hypothetical protein VL359_03120, partial [bacterium]|nr:hypothetical protein [bacterium]
MSLVVGTYSSESGMEWHVQWDGAASGTYNMAKDAYNLAQVVAGAAPILRLYTWDGWTLSVGRGQHVERQIDLAACGRLGVPLVRRPTGGRAVLHGEDLTYSLCARLDQPRFQGGIMAIYREVAGALQDFLRGLGLAPQVVGFDHRERAEASSPVCFATPSAYEILLGGKKIVGSAQRL